MNDQVTDPNDTSTLNVKILDKEYQVTCPIDQQNDLLEAARQYDARMREIRDSGKVIGIERIAVMAGLNITNEFLQAKERAEGKETTKLVKKLNRKIDNALQNAKQMEIG